MKASSAHRLLPFKTFGEAANFDLEVEVSCQCGRCVVIDGMAPTFRDRRIMGTRFRCTTILPHGVACAGLPSIYIRKRGRGRWTMAEHSRAIGARQAVAPIDAKLGTFASIVTRCEVAFLYDRGLRAVLHGRYDRIRRAAVGSLPRQAMAPVHLPRMRPDARHAR
jgi:hypothetical protein